MTIRSKKQWAKIDNENATKQKTAQAKCEDTWTSSFKNWRQRWGELGKALPLALLAVPKSSKSEQNQWAYENSYQGEINLEKPNCMSPTTQCKGSRQLRGCREPAGLAGQGRTPASDSPGLSHGTQDSKAPNLGLLQDLCWAIVLGTRPPCCWTNRDAWTRLFAERELLPHCQTGHFGSSPVSQTLAERSQTHMHLSENWLVLANGHFSHEKTKKKKGPINFQPKFSFVLFYFLLTSAAENRNVRKDVIVCDVAIYCLQTMTTIELHFLMSWKHNGRNFIMFLAQNIKY